MSLHSFQAKMIWAHEHMDALRVAINDFGRTNPCVVIHDFDPKTLKHAWRVAGKPDTPPQQLSLRLGDVLFNFRSALDHLAWNLVLANGQTPHARTGFPLCETAETFKSKSVRKQIEGMSDAVAARIETLQPYNAGDALDTQHSLGLLNTLGNIEKHRQFNLIAASLDLAAFNVEETLFTSSWIHQGPVEDGTIVAVAEGVVNVNFLMAFGVAFGQGGIAAGGIVDELLIRIELAVEDAIGELAFLAS